jgi:hypothetical protein
LFACTSTPEHEPPPKIKYVDAGQADYKFAGCANEDGPRCTRSRTVLCAVDLIASDESSTCTEDYDCELAFVNPRCTGLCGPIGVGADDQEELTAAAQFQIDSYCRVGTCAEDGCDAGTGWVPVCQMGFCRAVIPLDAGVPDASLAADSG